jgi:L-ribulokinase
MYSIGIDFGTESARAVLAEVTTGQIVASATFVYPHGVIDEVLPGSNTRLPPYWALQHPADWLDALQTLVPAVMLQAKASPEEVIGLGIDFTSCTILPTTLDGTPLCLLPKWQHSPHAWPKLWKHHAAQPQAERVTQLAVQRQEAFLQRYGGRISSEWLIPKVLSMVEEAPHVYDAAARILEAGDWIIWTLTGREVRNACAAGYKACWHKASGYPSSDFLAALNPRLKGLVEEKLSTTVYPPGSLAGYLTPEWAHRLGLRPETAVATAMIDAHAGTLGLGVIEPGAMAIIMGTSICHMVLATEERYVEGISGVVEDGIVPGLYGYEAGQAGAGDMLAWYLAHGVPPAYHQMIPHQAPDLHHVLAQDASRLRPGETGLLAVDWWNGCRTPLVDADLSGVVVGYTLATTPSAIYRALLEAIAYGTRLVIQTFEDYGIQVKRLVATGGLTKNTLLMQICADVTNRTIGISASDQSTALGAAILGATAAGPHRGGYPSVQEAAARMAAPLAATYSPDPQAASIYNLLYREYLRLVEFFGRHHNSPLKTLRRLRR